MIKGVRLKSFVNWIKEIYHSLTAIFLYIIACTRGNRNRAYYKINVQYRKNIHYTKYRDFWQI